MLLKAVILNHCTLALPPELIYAYVVLVFFNLGKSIQQQQQSFILQTYTCLLLASQKKSNQRTFIPELADLDLTAADGHKNCEIGLLLPFFGVLLSFNNKMKPE